MSGNAGNIGSQGIAKPSPQAVMEAYDRLPPNLRSTIANASLDWSTMPALAKLSEGESEQAFIQQIKEYERKHVSIVRAVDPA